MAGLADRPFSIPPGVPPSKAASHLLVSFRSPGLSCASCPAQSEAWQGGASLWNHTSQLFTLGSRHPTPLPFLCSAPTPCILRRMSMAPFWRKEKNGRKTGKQLHACFIGFSGAVGTAVRAGHQPQLKPRLSFIPVSLPRFAWDHLRRRKKWRLLLSEQKLTSTKSQFFCPQQQGCREFILRSVGVFLCCRTFFFLA